MQLQAPATSAAQRNYGVDALRILSILMVLVLHVLGMGGVIESTKPLGLNYFGAWTLETAAFCAVNCYGLISGYVGIHAKYRYTNLLMLWVQVFFYGIVFIVIQRLVDPASVDLSAMVKAAFPMLKKAFWYFTAYTGLFILLPMLNRGILALNRRQAVVLCMTIVVVFSVMPSLVAEDSFYMRNGYSPFWLMLLYVLGACIRRFDFGSKIPSIWLVVMYVGAVAVSMGVLAFLVTDTVSFLTELYPANVLVTYTAPTILLCGVALLLLFSRLQIRANGCVWLIRTLTPLVFGIYILHMQPVLRKFLFDSGFFMKLGGASLPVLVAGVFAGALGLFVACALIEKLRQLLFDVLGVKKWLERLEEKFVGNLWISEN